MFNEYHTTKGAPVHILHHIGNALRHRMGCSRSSFLLLSYCFPFTSAHLAARERRPEVPCGASRLASKALKTRHGACGHEGISAEQHAGGEQQKPLGLNGRATEEMASRAASASFRASEAQAKAQKRGPRPTVDAQSPGLNCNGHLSPEEGSLSRPRPLSSQASK